MVLAHPSLKPWIRAANTWMEAQKPSQQSMSNIYTSIILSQYWNLLSMMMNIWWFHFVQGVLEQLWHQLRKVAVLSTHAYVSRKIVGLLSGAPFFGFFQWLVFIKACEDVLPGMFASLIIKENQQLDDLSIVISTHRHRACFWTLFSACTMLGVCGAAFWPRVVQ